MFLDNLYEIAQDLSVYKNYNREQMMTAMVDMKLNVHINEYVRRLNDINFYIFRCNTIRTIKGQFKFDLSNLMSLIKIKQNNLEKCYGGTDDDRC